jgi:superfamily I DNA and/or RNA helicase
MALRFLVTEELHAKGTILLTAYTNRAVDEICEMLTTAGIDYLRLGNEASCDPRFASHLLEQRAGERPSLDALRRLIAGMPVIVSTTSMLQVRPYIFDLKHFSLCLVDEASQILEPSIVGILSKGIDRFVLIGDHKQLPAVVQQQDGGECARSLFERLLRQERQAGRDQFVGVLRRQGRMHPDVAAFTNEFFYREEQIAPVPLQHQMEVSLGYTAPSEDGLDELLKQERVVFFDSGSSGESVIVADLLRRIHRFYGDRFDAQKTVGVIVPYRIEIGRLRREIARLGIPVLNDISIDTVERYQGSQRDVIIYSFAVNDESQLSFLTATSFLEDNGQTIDRKLNVAMTRAREQLLMTGNSKILRVNPIFAALIARYTKSFS